MGIHKLQNGAQLIDEAIVIGHRRDEMGDGGDHAVYYPQRQLWGFSVEEAGEEDIGGAVVGEGVAVGGKGEEEAAVGLGEAVGVTESVDDAAEVEGVRAVAAEAEAIEEAESFVDIGFDCTQGVDSFSPVGAVGYADLIFY